VTAGHCFILVSFLPQPFKGHVFEVPVTVVKPEPLVAIPRPHLDRGPINFKPGDISRMFVQAPEGATWAVIRARSNELEASGKFVLHTVQLLPKLVVRTLEHQKMFTLPDNGEFTYGIPVKGLLPPSNCINSRSELSANSTFGNFGR
jgi:tripeptidyl-peptidase-2